MPALTVGVNCSASKALTSFGGGGLMGGVNIGSPQNRLGSGVNGVNWEVYVYLIM